METYRRIALLSLQDHGRRPAPGTASRCRQLSLAVQTRLPSSSVITMSNVDIVRPPCTSVATPVTSPDRAARWWVALISMPTVYLSGPACSAEPSEPSDSASTQDAPPCRIPYGWVLPSTGMVPTTRSGEASRILMPIRPARCVSWLLKVSLICCSRSDNSGTDTSSFLAFAARWCQRRGEPAGPEFPCLPGQGQRY